MGKKKAKKKKLLFGLLNLGTWLSPMFALATKEEKAAFLAGRGFFGWIHKKTRSSSPWIF